MLSRKAALTMLTMGSLLLLVGAALSVSSSSLEIAERHRPGPRQQPFDFGAGSFADYLEWSVELLRTARGVQATEAELANLAPFRLEPAADCPRAASRHLNGIVLVHELLESPFSLRDIANYFQSRCFLVLVPLLPGHGTRPGDFPLAEWQDWQEVVEFSTRQLETEVENLYLGGHGAGATLALLVAMEHENVDGLVLSAPALAVSAGGLRERLLASLGSVFPSLAWTELYPDEAPYRYESRPRSLFRELAPLVAATQAAWAARRRELPVFTVASMDDREVSVPAILEFIAGQRHPASTALVFASETVSVPPSTRMVLSHAPEFNILGLSHNGLMIPLSNSHYGWQAAWRDCRHYYHQDQIAYGRCKAGERDFLGEVTERNLGEGLLERSGFNFFHEELVAALDNFIGPVARIPVIQQR